MCKLADLLPFWKKIPRDVQELFTSTAIHRDASKGTRLHAGHGDCVGLIIVETGQLRAYTISEEGKELTLYRLYERDICLFSASCVFGNADLDIFVEVEADASLYYIPPDVYKRVMETNVAVSVFTNKLMSERFSDVMWTLDQVLNKHIDSRLAALLLEERDNSGSDTLYITHERLGSHLGSVREVITRMLRRFQDEGLVRLGRGNIQLVNIHGLEEMARDSIK